MHFSWFTFLLQAVNFLVLVWLLNRFAYKPVLALIDQRRNLVREELDAASAAKRDADAMLASMQSDRAAMAAERVELLTKARDEAAVERNRLVEAARAEAEANLTAARTRLTAETTAATETLRDAASKVAGSYLDAMLRALPAADLDAAYRHQMAAWLDDHAAERDRFLDAAGVERPATLRLAAGPGPEGTAAWQSMLNDRMPTLAGIDVVVDPDLITGAELEAGSARLRFSGRDALAQARQRLASAS